MAPRRHMRQRLLVLALLALAAAAMLALHPAGVLMLSPALALLGVIALGLFPDQRLILALRRRMSRPRRAVAALLAAPWLAVARPCGITRAFALAVRPPPAALTLTHA